MATCAKWGLTQEINRSLSKLVIMNNGETFDVHGKVAVLVRLSGFAIPVTFWVIEKYPRKGGRAVLGRDVLKLYKASLSRGKKTITIAGLSSPYLSVEEKAPYFE
jgi:hypothetical protein